MSTDDPDYHGGIRTSMMTWHDGAIVTLQNLRSARLLRAHPNKSVDVLGSEGQSTQWTVNLTKSKSLPVCVQLESLTHPGECLGVREGGGLAVGECACEFVVGMFEETFVLEVKERPKCFLRGNVDGAVRASVATELDDHIRFTVRRIK